MYSLKLRDLGYELEKSWYKEKEEVITVRCEKDGLRICTDEMAVYVNRDRRKHGIKKIKGALTRQGGVDVENISTDEVRALHERELVVGAAWLAGGQKEERIQLRAHRRQTPGLPPKREK